MWSMPPATASPALLRRPDRVEYRGQVVATLDQLGAGQGRTGDGIIGRHFQVPVVVHLALLADLLDWRADRHVLVGFLGGDQRVVGPLVGPAGDVARVDGNGGLAVDGPLGEFFRRAGRGAAHGVIDRGAVPVGVEGFGERLGHAFAGLGVFAGDLRGAHGGDLVVVHQEVVPTARVENGDGVNVGGLIRHHEFAVRAHVGGAHVQGLVYVARHVGQQQQRLAFRKAVRVDGGAVLALQDGDGFLQGLHDVVGGRPHVVVVVMVLLERDVRVMVLAGLGIGAHVGQHLRGLRTAVGALDAVGPVGDRLQAFARQQDGGHLLFGGRAFNEFVGDGAHHAVAVVAPGEGVGG